MAMAGSMRQRSERSWQLRVHGGRDPVTGRKRYLERTFHGTKRQAERALAALVTEAESFQPRSNQEATFGRLLHEWLEHAASSFSPRTVTVTRMYIDKTIIPSLGDVPVSKLGPADLDRFYRHLFTVGGPRVKYSPATIRRVHGIIRRALSQGVRWGWILHNPAIDASPPRVPLRRLAPPAPKAVVRLFKFAEESNPSLAVFVLLAASSGARRGELIALRWENLDFDHATMAVERGIVLADGHLVEQGTKSHQSRRLSLDARTVEALRGHRRSAEERAARFGAALDERAFVFSDAVDGASPWRPDSTTRAFRALCDSADIEGVRLHDLRHYSPARGWDRCEDGRRPPRSSQPKHHSQCIRALSP
jgi:integrase